MQLKSDDNNSRTRVEKENKREKRQKKLLAFGKNQLRND